MVEVNQGQQRKQTLLDLVTRLHTRTGRSYDEIRRRMGQELGDIEYSEGRFNKFRGKPDVQSDYQLDEMLALSRACTAGIAEDKRCTAREALQLFDLAGIELKAFQRLREVFPSAEFDKAWETYQSERKLAPESTSTSGDYFIPLYPHLFIGREDSIQHVYNRLGLTPGSSRYPTNIIRGWPGVGKTTLINRLVHNLDIRRTFTDGVLWTSLGPQGDVMNALKSWARQLRIFHVESLASEEAVVQALRGVLQNLNVLLVVDDIWTAEDGFYFKHLGSPTTTFLLTTRFTDVANALKEVPDDVYVLPTLSPAKSLEMLACIAPSASHNYADRLGSLVATLEGLPLALRVAGNLIEHEERSGLNVPDLIDQLEQAHSRKLIDSTTQVFDETTGSNPTMRLLFDRSLQTLQPFEQEAFAYLGAFAPKPATFALQAMKSVWQVEDPTPIIRALIGRGLLEPLGSGRFQMHYTLSMYAHSLLQDGDDNSSPNGNAE